jgi:CRISPR-associated endonuclease Csn1
LGALLCEAGLLPRFGTAEWTAAMRTDPYELRARALAGPLPPVEIGRALYHLVKRRGFVSVRSGNEEDPERTKEEGIVKEAIASLRTAMGERTLGQVLTDEAKKRDRYIGRDMVAEEFDAIWAAQAEHHPILLTESLKETLRAAAFHQRPMFWRLGTLGECRLEPGAPLCARGSWIGQRFVLFQALNSLRLAGGNARPLDAEERAVVLGLLEAAPSRTFGAVRRALKPMWGALGLPHWAPFNFEVGGKSALAGNIVEHELRRIFGPTWEDHPSRDRIRDNLYDRLHEIGYRRIGNKRIELRDDAERQEQRAAFVDSAIRDWRISETEAKALADLNLPSGWLRHSERAIRKLLPLLEAGKLYSEALDEAYPGHRERTSEALPRLPSHPDAMPEGRNPTVNRALNELRKVVNNLLAAHGRPDLIRIELARDLKLSPRKRLEVEAKNRKLEAQRKRAKDDLVRNGIVDPGRDDIEKWLLWKECAETCPYTGRKIGFDDLFRLGRFQVEHIFPRSRSLDNGFGNKTLCDVDENRRKGQRTPYEAYHADAERWHEIKLRLKAIDMPEAKARRFVKERFDDAETDEFAERQLRDTAYIAREARDFLLRLFGSEAGAADRVETCGGKITAQLRRFWGLNTVLGQSGEKNRADHRHHAVDAIAVALTCRAFVKRLSDYYRTERKSERAAFPLPWPSLRSDAEHAVGGIVVSHRARRKISGPLHAETRLGATEMTVAEGGKTYRYYVKRKPVSALSAKEVDTIRDDAVRRLARERLEAYGGDAKKAFAQPLEIVTGGGEVRLVRKVRVLVKRQPALVVPLDARTKAHADPGENHHMAVFRLTSGAARVDVVTRFEATRRLAAKQPVIQRDGGGDGALFVMSLAPGDTLEFPADGGERSRFYVVNGMKANGQVELDGHTTADRSDRTWPTASSLLRAGVRKVSVDPIGRVRPAHD